MSTPFQPDGGPTDRRRKKSRRHRPWWKRQTLYRRVFRTLFVALFLILVFVYAYYQASWMNRRAPSDGAAAGPASTAV